MATIRLIPSTYAVSSSTYLSVSNASNMYANTDSETYATVTNSQNGTTSYYLYIRGFNFSDIPSNATINSWSVKLKARESGITTNSSYAPKLCHGTSQITSTCSAIGTTATVYTFTGVGEDWSGIVEYGSDFGIRINCRRASRNTTGYMYVYGAEIEVNYTVPNPAVVTSSLDGEGTISPSGAYNTYKDDVYTLTITPTDKSEEVTVTKDGVDVTSELVAHGVGSTNTFTPTDVTTSGIQSGSSYAEYAVGHSAESPASSSNNMYASSNSTGYAAYSFDFSDIPSNAVIESIEVRCYGHRESNTISSTYVSQCAIYNGSTAVSDEVDFPSTSDSMITITPNSVPTRAQLDNLTVRHYVGYYGGLVLGISFEVTYSVGTGIDHYTYTFTVDGDSTISVVIGGDKLFAKINGGWVKAKKIFKKINGVWTEVKADTLTDRVPYMWKGPLDYSNESVVFNLDGIDSYAGRYYDEENEGYIGDEIYPIGISGNFMRGVDIVPDGQSFEFNGTSSYMRPSASAAFDKFLYNTHTLEMFFEPFTWGTEENNRTVLYVGRSSTSIALYIYFNDDVLRIVRSSTSTKTLNISPLALNTKHYIAVNNNGFFVDGTFYSDASLDTDTVSVLPNDELSVDNTWKCASVGRRFRSSSTPQFFHGKVYAVRIHDTLLSEAEMRNNNEMDIRRFV